MCRIFEDEKLAAKIHNKFVKSWRQKILSFAEKQKGTKHFIEEMQLALSQENSETQGITKCYFIPAVHTHTHRFLWHIILMFRAI